MDKGAFETARGVAGPGVESDGVVTLARPKTGLRGIEADLLLADIGLPTGVYERLDISTFVFPEYVVGHLTGGLLNP